MTTFHRNSSVVIWPSNRTEIAREQEKNCHFSRNRAVNFNCVCEASSISWVRFGRDLSVISPEDLNLRRKRDHLCLPTCVHALIQTIYSKLPRFKEILAIPLSNRTGYSVYATELHQKSTNANGLYSISTGLKATRQSETCSFSADTLKHCVLWIISDFLQLFCRPSKTRQSPSKESQNFPIARLPLSQARAECVKTEPCDLAFIQWKCAGQLSRLAPTCRMDVLGQSQDHPAKEWRIVPWLTP